MVEAGLDVAALGVELGVAEAEPNRARALPAVQADTAVALLLGEVEVAFMPATLSKRPLTVSALGLDLLHPIQSAPTPSAQASKPLAAAERMPFRFREPAEHTHPA